MTHVLIVEDHEEDRMLLKMRLEANGYQVTVAGDGLECCTPRGPIHPMPSSPTS